MTVYFHGNFGLNRSRMATLLERALAYPEMHDKELAEPYGYGATYGQRYRSWLHKTGIIELDFPVRLTPLGEVIWQYDPKLETLTTQWFLHWELTIDSERAEAWYYFTHEFLPRHEHFTRQELANGIGMKFLPHSEKHFGPNGTLTPIL